MTSKTITITLDGYDAYCLGLWLTEAIKHVVGYRNNNCIGCVKGGMGYWNKLRRDFPEVFERMAALQRDLGPGSYFWRERDTGERISLDMLDPERGRYEAEPDIECSLMCHSSISDDAEDPGPAAPDKDVGNE